jgi:hypothetical protein
MSVWSVLNMLSRVGVFNDTLTGDAAIRYCQEAAAPTSSRDAGVDHFVLFRSG